MTFQTLIDKAISLMFDNRIDRILRVFTKQLNKLDALITQIDNERAGNQEAINRLMNANADLKIEAERARAVAKQIDGIINPA